MVDDNDTVQCQVHIGFLVDHARVNGSAEGAHRIFGPLVSSASVSDDEWSSLICPLGIY